MDALVIGEHEVLVFQHEVNRVGAGGGNSVKEVLTFTQAGQVLRQLGKGPGEHLARHAQKAAFIAVGRGIGK